MHTYSDYKPDYNPHQDGTLKVNQGRSSRKHPKISMLQDNANNLPGNRLTA